MTIVRFRRLVVAGALVGAVAGSVQAAEGPPAPSLAAALRLKKSAIVFQPVQMKRDQSLVVTHTKFADGSVRTGEQRAVQLIVYDSQADQTGQHAVLFRDLQVITSAGPGGGPHVKAFSAYTPLENQGIIAVLIGLLLPAVQSDPPKIVPLPAADALTAELRDPVGIGLLLPAVQKVRDAAGR